MIKQISNPFSTGGGGGQFEAHVQASFVVLMLTEGFVPCMPFWPIKKIMLQGNFAGYETDDLIVFVEKKDSKQQRKVLGQIKHSIKITAKDPVFGEVIQAAWNDFNNPMLFNKRKDVIALITGPLSATDINDVRTVLEWARHSENADNFFRKVNLSHFSSQGKRDKLNAFKIKLEKANENNLISDGDFFEFLTHFHLLGYDLDIKTGVTLSLLHSLIGHYSEENVQSIWTQLIDEVQSVNKNAGTISLGSLPEDLQKAFKQRIYKTIPEEFSKVILPSGSLDWNQEVFASDLVTANLIGSWDEKNETDKEVICRLANKEYDIWISNIREVLQQPSSPISQKNGRWYVDERATLWNTLGGRVFDEDLKRLKDVIVNVLSERNPIFYLPNEERYAYSITGKGLNYSQELRKGLAETLALLANKYDNLINFSHLESKDIASSAVYRIFDNVDWILWASLNKLLPLLAEADPNGFLRAVDRTIQMSPCPFDELFFQESINLTGENYHTGLLWALETFAWDEQLIVRVCLILGELGNGFNDESKGNRALNSLKMIMLPWLPQTSAPFKKRQVVLKNLQKEVPNISWQLVLGLLPNKNQISSGTQKPNFLDIIPSSWEKGVTQKEYWEQVSFYADEAVSMAGYDVVKLNELIRHFDSLPESSFEKFLRQLSSESIARQPEDERLVLWDNLLRFISRQKRFPDAKWSVGSEIIKRIEDIAQRLAPTNPLYLYRRWFTEKEYDLYSENKNWDAQRQQLEKNRQQAVKEILVYGGMNSIVQFSESVESPFILGSVLGIFGQLINDKVIFPDLLEDQSKKKNQFVSGYTWNRHRQNGWLWADGLDRSNWSASQVGQFLSYLPFTEEAWGRATAWLKKDEKEYWSKTNAVPYHTDNLDIAVEKLIEYERPHAAIDCLYRMYQNENVLNSAKSVKALQGDSSVDPEDLFRVEWEYLQLLDRSDGAYPQNLENRLASDPLYFTGVIRLLYRSKKESKSKNVITNIEENVASKAWELLYRWQTPPGQQRNREFFDEQFVKWLDQVKQLSSESGHFEVALIHVGKVLIYCPPDPNGLWINETVATALNAKDAEDLRNGFYQELIHSRGVYWVDPTGEQELELAKKFNQKAEDAENAGYSRIAAMLRGLAETYIRNAIQIKGNNDILHKNRDN